MPYKCQHRIIRVRRVSYLLFHELQQAEVDDTGYLSEESGRKQRHYVRKVVNHNQTETSQNTIS